jgi:hypothetical protein
MLWVLAIGTMLVAILIFAGMMKEEGNGLSIGFSLMLFINLASGDIPGAALIQIK